MIDLKFPVNFDKTVLENALAIGKDHDIEYGEDGNPIIFTDYPLEIKQRIVSFYGMIDFTMSVFDLTKDFS